MIELSDSINSVKKLGLIFLNVLQIYFMSMGNSFFFFTLSKFTILSFYVVAQFSVVTTFLQPDGLQHSRLPCPSPSPRAYSELMSIESVMPSNYLIFFHPLLLLPQSIPRSGAFLMSQLLSSGGQNIGASASA